ncbi:siderophore-interacting protein [Enteractinococcus coprophilus]|uniref:NADPH-dependent ferric siderophore reductase n=1 Tax=Enteractinococcus coprophilus TaxID=1027633 RepID=A0A543AGQ2_9MICC|nr:siderophore-interacting protein [Enteractinococcus coprophilus]TQL71774.1 NADPH-dependent ferric siderophore reductase [Enteractinococcus coprophilus]
MTHILHGPVRGIVHSVRQLSPTFQRIVFTGGQLNELAAVGPFYDQRIKIILPNDAGHLPGIVEGADWYQRWLALPDAERGTMRTYSIRHLVRADGATYLTVDFVLHGIADGETGPAAAWAANATAGDELLLVAPHQGQAPSGIEFHPGGAQDIILLGDESAAPAIARILEDLNEHGTSANVCAYIEVPSAQDQLPIDTAIQVQWLCRNNENLGEPLAKALGWHIQEVQDDQDELLWETPVFSASGEEVAENPAPHTGTYYWIAGESGVIKKLRRFLVNDVGVERSQVAFMGYWRHGVAMRG